MKKAEVFNPYQEVTQWFNNGNSIELLLNSNNLDFGKTLRNIPGLEDIV